MKGNYYQKHVANHAGLKPHPCDECDMRFLYPNKLRVHKLTHAKMHACKICGEQFKNFLAVRKHLSIAHHKVKTCLECDQKFPSRSQLKQHMKTHDNDRPVLECPESNCDRYTTVTVLSFKSAIHSSVFILLFSEHSCTSET